MIALGRLLIIGLVVLSVVYLITLLRLRAQKRAELEDEWRDVGQPGDLDTFVDAGLEKHQKLRRWSLFALVYGLPICIVAIIIYLTNFH
ncbi:hypothetical protein [uncultured Pelagimonas sp.]|uniref:hypothetical protein n=1 Tax=uncultured Pelagimonas sp. TaxID=1618102 RepID=UPI002608DA27|nr:hypothetical protein [uncultured Pelagimonas sp.]